MSLLQTPLPNGKPQNNYDAKPRRTGTYYLTNNGWKYTAKPEDFRTGFGNESELAFPFYITPDHMKVENQ